MDKRVEDGCNKSYITVFIVFIHFFVLDRNTGLEVSMFEGSDNSSAQNWRHRHGLRMRLKRLKGYLRCML